MDGARQESDIEQFIKRHGLGAAGDVTLRRYNPDQVLPRLATEGIYSGWGWIEQGGRWALFSEELNAALAKGFDLPLTQLDSAYQIPDAVRLFAAAVLRGKASAGTRIFNSVKLRLASDIALDASEVVVQPTDYFSTLVTNDAALLRVEVAGRRRLGLDLLASDGVVLPLADSLSSNHIGVSCIAITSDDRLIILHQSHDAAHYPGLLMPSGSGAIALDDLQDGDTLASAASRAMAREIREECGIAGDLIAKIQLTGFSRQLDRGGKPELYGVAFLDHRFDDLGSEENLFIAGIGSLDLAGAPLESLPQILDTFRVERDTAISFSLYTALAFLEHYLGAVDEEALLALRH